MNDIRERFLFWIIWNTPKMLIYLAGVRLLAYASQTKKLENTEMGAIKAMDALDVWDDGHGLGVRRK